MPASRALLIAFGILAAPAHAADCAPQRIVSSVEMLPLHGGPLMLVPVYVNGARENFLIDTGGSLSQLTAASAERLRLSLQPAKTRLYDMFGNSDARQAAIEDFAIGNLKSHSTVLWIQPEAQDAHRPFDFLFALRRPLRPRVEGILAPDLMANYDIEMDFGHRMLKFLSPDHCEGKVVYWPAPQVADVPMTFDALKITVPVMLDGHAMTALIDTGSAKSSMSLQAARTVFGLAPGKGLERSGPFGATGEEVYSLHLRLLSFEGVRVDYPVLQVIPDLISPNASDGDKRTMVLPQLLLGMDILSRLHLYFAFRENRIYVTEANY